MTRDISPTAYILASRRSGTLYTRVTADRIKHRYQHRNGLIDGFTSEYGVRRLVWFEPHESMESAILRGMRIKKWKRQWKIDLIETANRAWNDLAIALGFDPLPSWSIGRETGSRFDGNDEVGG